MLNQKSAISSLVLVVALMFWNCDRADTRTENPGAGSANPLEEKNSDANAWISAESIMAVAVSNEKENIYVAETYRSEVQEELKAEISNNVWTFRNAAGMLEKRTEKTLKNINAGPVVVAEWVYARGYACVEKEAGYILPIHRAGDPKRKIMAGYETTEPGKWCEDNPRGRCKFIWKDVTSRFIKVRNGKLLKRNGEFVRSDTTTLRIMSCVD